MARDASFVFGLALVAVGIGLFNVPAGIVIAGVEIAVVAYFTEPDEPTE